jgi:SAM-dependent methyltransferase
MTAVADPPPPFSIEHRRADQYDDSAFDYLNYWVGREYEHSAEQLAIRRLLSGRHFAQAVDVGGGYGRLSVILGEYADRVTLAEPSHRQLALAERFLVGCPMIARTSMQADHLRFDDHSVDLLLMVRLLHHLPDPGAEFAEIARVLAPGGLAIVELANSAHARNRIRYALRGRPVPADPMNLRTASAGPGIPFVNHHPHTVIQQLALAGLRVERRLSVSNLRSAGLKRILSRGVMLRLERVLQPALARVLFGPSIFLLVRSAESGG